MGIETFRAIAATYPQDQARVTFGDGDKISVEAKVSFGDKLGRAFRVSSSKANIVANNDIRRELAMSLGAELGISTKDYGKLLQTLQKTLGKDVFNADYFKGSGLKSGRPLSMRRIQAVLTAVDEVKNSISRDIEMFEAVDESETVKSFYESVGSGENSLGNINAAVTNELALRKNLNLFEQMTGIKMTPAERRMCVANVSARSGLVAGDVNKFDLSVPDNCNKLKARIEELRSGECYGASENALKTLSIMMFARPEMKMGDVRKVLQLAKQCREAGVGNAGDAGKKPPLQRLREIASAIGEATAVEFGTWLARADGKQKGWSAEQIATLDYKEADLQHNDDSHMMANMLMRVLIAESDGLGDLLQSLTMDDIVPLAIDRKDVEFGFAKPSADKIRLRKLMGNSSEEAVERDKTLTPAEREEVDRLTKAEVGRFIRMALLKEFEREATVHVDAVEVDRRIDAYYDEVASEYNAMELVGAAI